MKNYIDIHSHILPGVDDGAGDPGTSMKMLETAFQDGISGIILTPHNKPGHRHRTDPSGILQKVEELQSRISAEGMELQLYIGNELYYRSELVAELEEGLALTLAGSQYVLVEFGIMDDFEYIRNGIYTLLSGGYYPVLAHAERYRNVCTRKSGIADLIEMGAYIQLNAGSIMGKFGWTARRYTRKLLKQQMVHFIATDAHDMDKRAPYLAACADYIGKKFGEDYRKKLFHDNPMNIIRGNSDGKTQR